MSLGSSTSPETNAFRFRSVLSRLARNTSASSSSNTQPHLWASWKHLSRLYSTSSALSPISPQVMANSGRCVNSATHSAVDVFPTPGAPWRRMISPFPFPRTRSTLCRTSGASVPLSESLKCVSTKAWTISWWPSGRTNFEKLSCSGGVKGPILSMSRRAVRESGLVGDGLFA